MKEELKAEIKENLRKELMEETEIKMTKLEQGSRDALKKKANQIFKKMRTDLKTKLDAEVEKLEEKVGGFEKVYRSACEASINKPNLERCKQELASEFAIRMNRTAFSSTA